MDPLTQFALMTLAFAGATPLVFWLSMRSGRL